MSRYLYSYVYLVGMFNRGGVYDRGGVMIGAWRTINQSKERNVYMAN
jgi:hypothetical protein